jgi:transmembrane sensor
MRVQRQIDDLLAQRASEWLEVLKTAGESERAAFIDWLGESRLHVQEFLEVVAVDRELDGLDAQRLEDVEALLARVTPVASFNTPAARTAGRRPRTRRWKWSVAAAASLAVGVLGLVLLAEVVRGQAFITRVGEQRTIELQDASVVHLNADSEISVQLADSERRIRLLHGEALFKVARDMARPFRVVTRTATVQALGTQFNIYERPEGTRVSVLEGRVQITTAHAAQVLGAGEEVLVRSNGSIQRNTHPKVEQAVAWRQRRLIFDNATLEDVVREFNRYNAAQPIRLQGIAPGSHHYDGIFDADDPASLAQLLRRERDLIVEMREREILVRRRD